MIILMDNQAHDGYHSKKRHKNNGNVEDQAFHAAPCLEDGACATAAEDAAESGTAYLEQNKHNNGHRDDDLYNSDSRDPLCQETVLTFLFYEQFLANYTIAQSIRRVLLAPLYEIWASS
jgi:hypothetical protein